MKKELLSLPGLCVVIPDIFDDHRGFLFESYNKRDYAELGITQEFVQDNHSKSVGKTLRGLHFQKKPGQSKLIRVVKGVIQDITVDIRPDSKTCGLWESVELSAENRKQLYIPVGFAHGFCVLSEEAEVLYKASSFYNPDTEQTIAWDDPDIAIDWMVTDPVLSKRDKNGISFNEYLTNAVGGSG